MAKTMNQNVAKMFGGAQAVQLRQKEEEIAELKKQLTELSSGKTQADGLRRYPISDFIPLSLPNGLTQPRKYFDPEAMDKLKASIQKVGVQEPLLARRSKDKKLEIVSGERRWRCATELGLSELPVIEKELSDEDALEIALVANLMRENLNPVEETDSIVALISLRLNIQIDEITPILFRIKNLRSRYHKTNEDIAQELMRNSENSRILTHESINQIDLIVTEFSLSLESFVSNRLVPLQSMPDILLDAVREGNIGLSKADVIRKGSLPEDKQEELLTAAIDEKLSKREISEKLKQLQADPQKTQNESSLKDRVHGQYRTVFKKANWEKIESTPKLKKKMERIEALLQELIASASE